jgi:hypothetical protein
VTRAASTGRTLPTAQLEALSGAGRAPAPGDVQVWDLPAGHIPGTWLVSGTGAVRVVVLDRAGAPLLDREVLPGEGSAPRSLNLPPAAARVVVASPGAVPGPATGCGWQSGTLLAQVGPATLLGRRCGVRLSSRLLTRHDGTTTGQALVRATAALTGSRSTETWLPADVVAVVVLVDLVDLEAGTDVGDRLPLVEVRGATVAGPPVVVATGRRLRLTHEITGREADRPLIMVAVTTGPVRRLAGVLGERGPSGGVHR